MKKRKEREGREKKEVARLYDVINVGNGVINPGKRKKTRCCRNSSFPFLFSSTSSPKYYTFSKGNHGMLGPRSKVVESEGYYKRLEFIRD